MSRYPRIAVLAVLAATVVFAGCNKEDAPASGSAQGQASAALAVPTSSDDGEWQQYVGRQIAKNIRRKSKPPFALFLSSNAETQEEQIQTMKNTVMRPIERDTTLGFGATDSSLLASRMAEIFQAVPEGALDQRRVVFVGKAEDQATVEAAVKASGAELVFVPIGS